MPVFVETLTEPSPQDLIDLAKIFADAPTWLLASHADATELVQAALAEGSLVAGRFNDRLLGAALLRRNTPHWQLSHLCVRKITRKRGVGRRIIDEARRMATEAGQDLQLAAPAEQLETQALAARMQLTLVPL